MAMEKERNCAKKPVSVNPISPPTEIRGVAAENRPFVP